MTFEVGRLSAALTLEGVQDFHRGLDEAGRKLTESGQRGASFGRAVEAGVRTAAGATVALTAAAGAYLTILAKQGVAYNSMQQNSRAALSVILGGTEKANAQMAKLDDFARNSPFSKSVFIQAQQQLLGFGMEASKVIPTLDAIQQSMAAMGRGSEDISEVVRVLAQVTSTGKFTGETLQQLGVRGIDAATLIGERMGRTGAEIREGITAGTIGGEEALTHLVAAMGNKFGGAADLVKEQWSGAVDRIKAANRDLGAVIAEPFVSAQGGGMAVTWGNQVADVLRAIEKQAIPVVQILTQRSMPFFSSLTTGLDSAQASIQRWNPQSLETSLDKMAGHAPGIAALVGATIALGAQVGPLGTMLKTLGISANPALAAFVGLAAASPELREALAGLLSAGKPLLPLVGELAVVMSGALNSAIPLVSGSIDVLTSLLRPAVSLIESIPAPVLAGAIAFLALHGATKTLNVPIAKLMSTLGDTSAIRAFNAGLSPTSAMLAGVSGAATGAKNAAVGLGNALKATFLSNPIGIALTVISAAVGVWAIANANAQQKVEEHNNRVASLKETLNQTTGALTDASRATVEQNIANTNARDLAERMGISYRDVTEAALGNEEAMKRVQVATEAYALEYGALVNDKGEVFKGAREESRSAARSVNELRDALMQQREAAEAAQQQLREKIAADREAAAAMTDAARSNQRFNDALAVARDVTQDAETRVRALKQALDELKGGAISAEEAQKRLSETNLTLAEGLASTGEAGEKLWQSTLKSNGEIEMGSRNGLAFADAMGRSRDAMLAAAQAASDQALANGDVAGAVTAAQAAGDSYIDTLRQTMTDAEIAAEQIDGLIGTYLDVPSVVATLLTDNGTISEVDQAALALALQIANVPDGKSIEVTDPGNPAVIKRIEDLGGKVEKVPGGKNIRITQTGADIVESILNNLTRSRTATVHIAQGLGGAGGLTRADGGLDVHQGNRMVHAFANGGGYPTGIYAGGPPLIKFAEPETGWEAFISGRPGQEARNAKIAMDALHRLGFPVVPVSALRGIPAFADGGTVGGRSARATPTELDWHGAAPEWNMTIINPVVRDPFEQSWEEAQEKGVL